MRSTTDAENWILAQVDDLVAERHRGAGKLPIPSDLDRRVSALVEVWATLPEQSRRDIAYLFDETHSFTFITAAERLASLAVRTTSIQPIVAGLTALVLEGGKFDSREDIPVMGLLYDAAVKVGEDPKVLFATAADLLDNEISRVLGAFPDRPERLRCLEGMGYIEASDDDGFLYKRLR